MSFIVIVILFFITLALTAMTAAYLMLSTHHLRYWARKKDPAAIKLYPLKARGSASYLTLELLRALSLSAAIILLTINLGGLMAWLVSASIFFIAFTVLTQLYLKPLGVRLLMWLSRPLLTITNALKPITVPLGSILDTFKSEEPVTVTRGQLKDTLSSVDLDDTDLSQYELNLLRGVLDFTAKSVHDIMIPKSKIVTVNADEALTPIVRDELHKSGYDRFPVLGDDKKNVIGIINMHDIMDISHDNIVAKDIMTKVFFIDEDRDLEHVLQVFYKTKQSVFVVNNAASDMVGLITVEGIVQEVIGKHSESKIQSPPPRPEASEEHQKVVK